LIYLIRYNHQLLVLGLANDQLTALDQACHCPATTEEEPRPMGQRLPGPLFLSPPGLFHRVEHWLRERPSPIKYAISAWASRATSTAPTGRYYTRWWPKS